MSERDKRIEKLFHEALDLAPAQRRKFLYNTCGDDDALRSEVLKLLAHDSAAPIEFLSGDAPTDIDNKSEDWHEVAPMPEQIGRYRVIRRIGQGGMGTVYEAEQDNPRRRVALKVIRHEFATRQTTQRFQREAAVLGHLQHPGIAAIYEAGYDDDTEVNRWFLALELIHGKPLMEFAEGNHLALHQRLELMARVCDAVQHAHQRGVIHRDLKPGNILVVKHTTAHDESDTDDTSGSGTFIDTIGQPKILDFGIARVMDPDLQVLTQQTQPGQIVGTLAYMSPEQLAGDTSDLDIRCDIYALGVLIYEITSGHLPYNLTNKPIGEAARIIRDEEPTRVSQYNTLLRGDVATIVAKAMDKDRERRYDTAAELAADLRRYLHNEPISARPTSTLYQLGKFARRNKGLVAGIVMAFISLLFGVVGISYKAISENAARRLAETAAYQAHLSAAAAAIREQDLPTAEQHLSQAPENKRGWEWYHFQSQIDQSLRVVQLCDPIDSGARAQFAFRDGDGAIRFWWHAACRLTMLHGDALFPDPEPIWSQDNISTATLTQDGRSVLVWENDGTAKLLDAETGVPTDLITVPLHVPVQEISFLNFPGGISLTSVGCILESIGPLKSRVFLCFSPDGNLMALSYRLDCTIWDLKSGQKLHELSSHPEGADGLAFSPDGLRLVTAGRDRKIRMFDLEHNGTLVWETPHGHTDAALTVAFSQDSKLIASGGQDRIVRLWEADTGEPSGELMGHHKSIISISFSHDNRRILSADHESVRIWDIETTRDLRILWPGRPNQVRALAMSPDGALLASGYMELCIWDTLTGKLVAIIPVVRNAETYIVGLGFNPEGTQVAVTLVHGDMSGTVAIVDIQSGRIEEIENLENGVSGPILFAPDGSSLIAGVKGNIVLWETKTFKVITQFPQSSIYLAFDPDGRYLAASNLPYGTRIYDMQTLEVYREWPDLFALSLAFSNDGRWLAAGSNNEIVIVDVSSGQLVATLRGHTDNVYSLAFLPADTRLASGSNDCTIRLWDLNTFTELAQLRGHVDRVTGLVVTPDGSRLLSSSGDYTVRMWDTQPLRMMLDARVEYEITSTRLSPLIHDLFNQLGSGQQVLDHLESDMMLSPRERQIAQQLILRESITRQNLGR